MEIYGRGAEDNGQELVASLYAAKAVIDGNIEPENNICLAFVSDEEPGSRYGILHLLSKNRFNYHMKAYPGGIDGGTCATLFRKQGFDAVIWGKIDDACHMPNEYCRIENMVNDVKVYGKIFSE